jgi:hypothetical protein
MSKHYRVANVAAVFLGYNLDAPDKIFTQIKDGGYPNKAVQHRMCPTGGNWVGAANCKSPLQLVVLETDQEMTFNPETDLSEIKKLGLGSITSAASNALLQVPTKDDISTLELIKSAFIANMRPHDLRVNFFPTETIRHYDPSSTKTGFNVAVCTFTSGIDKYLWAELERLNRTYGRVLNEGYSAAISLRQILERGMEAAFAHGHFYKDFFISHGCAGAGDFVLQPYTRSEYVSPVPGSFQELLKAFEVAKMPDSWATTYGK